MKKKEEAKKKDNNKKIQIEDFRNVLNILKHIIDKSRDKCFKRELEKNNKIGIIKRGRKYLYNENLFTNKCPEGNFLGVDTTHFIYREK